MLEEQFQPDGVARPFLHLGLSDNMSVTLDRPSRAARGHVGLGQRCAARPGSDLPGRDLLLPLAQGGDNFTTFTSAPTCVTPA